MNGVLTTMSLSLPHSGIAPTQLLTPQLGATGLIMYLPDTPVCEFRHLVSFQPRKPGASELTVSARRKIVRVPCVSHTFSVLYRSSRQDIMNEDSPHKGRESRMTPTACWQVEQFSTIIIKTIASTIIDYIDFVCTLCNDQGVISTDHI